MTTTKEQPINSKNWTEDYPHENGCYTNRCIDCGDEFCGHKRRVVCKLCDRLSRLTAERDAYKASLEHIRDMPDYDQDNEHRLRNTARQALEGGSKDGSS
jgi:hypothetical protein